MAQGKVKWFNDAKGFGFLEQDSGEDVFVHYSDIQTDGYRSLKEGQNVEFELAKADKGWRAANVRSLPSDNALESGDGLESDSGLAGDDALENEDAPNAAALVGAQSAGSN